MAKTFNEIQTRKLRFINQYNPGQTEVLAIKSGINSAVRRACVYSPNMTKEEKTKIRSFWGQCLSELGGKYIESQNEEQFKKDIQDLQEKMNKQFFNVFNPDERHRGFRIAQAQKSLSVYLKHMWCMNKIPTPPTCPIDRTILGSSWIYDDYEQYCNHLELVKTRNTTEECLSVWELFAFQR